MLLGGHNYFSELEFKAHFSGSELCFPYKYITNVGPAAFMFKRKQF